MSINSSSLLREIQVAAAIIWRDGKILAAQRAASDYLGGYWEFPGGKIEPHETPAQCLLREIDEELSLRIEVQDHFLTVTHDYPKFRIHLAAYTCSYIGGDAILSEHQTVRWITKDELKSLAWAPADGPIVEKLFNHWELQISSSCPSVARE